MKQKQKSMATILKLKNNRGECWKDENGELLFTFSNDIEKAGVVWKTLFNLSQQDKNQTVA